MVDVHTPQQRSYNMSRIRGKWTGPEKRLHGYLKGVKIKHTMHPEMYGKPDILLKDTKTVIFIDGCFWHGCPVHGHIPETRSAFWKAKFIRNKEKDIENTKKLKGMGYRVVRIWECELKNKMYDKLVFVSG